jgi:transcriptional regulator with XRE-family HTH domain
MGNIIRDLRIKKRLSQQKCADEIGISKRTLQRYEQGSFGNIEYLKKIAVYFNVSLDELGVIPSKENQER